MKNAKEDYRYFKLCPEMINKRAWNFYLFLFKVLHSDSRENGKSSYGNFH